jgi:DNA invertase Pin-like site-specific DNA recombinase
MKPINISHQTTCVRDDQGQNSSIKAADAVADNFNLCEPRSFRGSQEASRTGGAQNCATDRTTNRSRRLRQTPGSAWQKPETPIIRVALYGRYSSDLQNPKSVEDQFHICGEYSERQPNWKIVATFRDEEISGESLLLRPGIQQLIDAALRGEFDVVLAEAIDRISRDPADTHSVYKQLTFAGVRLWTPSDGEANDMIIGFKGVMNSEYLKELRRKTRRGLEGRVRQGKAAGGLGYGYDVVKHVDAHGEPLRGDRKINLVQAEIVERVFREYADGLSPLTIAKRLNEEAESDPNKLSPNGGKWTDSTVRGHPKRGCGIINNELYIGKIVWNKTRKLRSPFTGKKVIRDNPPEMWTVKEVPELRIVSDELWEAVKARQALLRTRYANVIAGVRAHHASRGTALNSTHRPRTPFSGLLECGNCGSPYAIVGRDAYGCSGHKNNGMCSNRRTISRKELQARVIGALRGPLLDPKLVEGAISVFTEEMNRLNREWLSTYDSRQKTLLEVQRKIKNLTAAILDGGYTRSLIAQQQELEAQEEELKNELASAPTPVLIRPDIAEALRSKVEHLAEALQTSNENDEIFFLIRSLIDHITITPDIAVKRGKIAVTLHGDLARLLEISVSVEPGSRLHRDRCLLAIAA